MKGAIGIGTLIIFIAMVLVAAVAASVLIQTSSYLQQKAMLTGRTTTEEVSTGLKVVAIYGAIDRAQNQIIKLAVVIEPNAGSAPLDLGTTKLTISNSTTQAELKYDNDCYNDSIEYKDIFDDNYNVWPKFGNTSTLSCAANATETSYGILVLQDADGSVRQDSPIINRGDRVALTVNVRDLFGGIGPRTHVTGFVRPEFGAPGVIDFVTPVLYTETRMQLQ